MLEKKERYDYEDLKEIVAWLRSEQGCPWDKAQTHESLKECMENECAEALEAIDEYQASGEWKHLCEELGDVLLQVYFHAQIAQENGLFSIEDVVNGVSRKMLRRHPHVFGELSEGYVDGKCLSWKEIKRMEKEGKFQ